MRDWRSYLYISGNLGSIYFLIHRYLLYFLSYSPPLQLFQLFEKYHCICIILWNYTDIYIYIHTQQRWTIWTILISPLLISTLYANGAGASLNVPQEMRNFLVRLRKKQISFLKTSRQLIIQNFQTLKWNLLLVSYFLKWFYLCCCVTVLHYCHLMATLWT